MAARERGPEKSVSWHATVLQRHPGVRIPHDPPTRGGVSTIDTPAGQAVDMTAPSPTLTAARHGLLLADIRCYHCQALTSVAAIWVADFEEHEDGEVIGNGEAALLAYPKWLDEGVTRLIRIHVPWMRLAATKTTETTYWANHCQVCGAAHGDHYVGGVDGLYWPQDDEALARPTFVRGAGPLRAVGSSSQSSWMTRVEDVCG